MQNRDGSFTGFIRVQFQLTRPVSLPPPRKLSLTQEGQSQVASKQRTSFYLPRDSAKHLHISSQTRAREVIEALLNKFTVVDNAAKFALFERTERQHQGEIINVSLENTFGEMDNVIHSMGCCCCFTVYLRKLSDDAYPLHLRLCAGPGEEALSLVLKENETGDINVCFKCGSREHQHCRHACLNLSFKMIDTSFVFFQWDAFSFPELCNFLRMLQREEEEHIRQIIKRYALARDRIKQAMSDVSMVC